jgi:hypothetical protein
VSALHARAPRRRAPSLEACVGGAAAALAGGLFMLAGLSNVCVLELVDLPAARAATPVSTAYLRPPPGDNDLFGYDKDSDLGNGAAGKRHQGAEGRMGSLTARRDHGLYGLKGRRNEPDPHLARQRAEAAGRAAGMLAVLRGGSHIASVFGRDTAVGRDADDALGGLVGTRVQEARGAGGLALVGTGPAGRGTGEGTIGLTNCGGIGKGGG